MKTTTYILALLALAGCAQGVHPAATADDVLAAQYRTRTPHGAMAGAEAGIIADSYRKNIAAGPAPDMAAAAGSK
jgi:hypothetical protein